jgi:hypothetical protein
MSDPLVAAIVWGVVWFFLMYAGFFVAWVISVMTLGSFGVTEFKSLGSSRRTRSVTGPLAVAMILSWIAAFAWAGFCLIHVIIQIISIFQVAFA